MKGKTKSGFKFDIDERIFDDWYFLEAIAKADNSENPSAMLAGTVELVNLMFGDDKTKLLEHIKSKNDGFAPQEVVKAEILDIIEQSKNLKNSSSSEG